jgi:hypothetical protein
MDLSEIFATGMQKKNTRVAAASEQYKSFSNK